MADFLWNIFIYPLQLIIEVSYALLIKVFGNPGLAIIGVSVVVSTLTLPLYRKADALQEEEREKQKSMEKWVKHIKATFKGDKRFMMLSAYYEEQGYKPMYALKNSLSILIQIPFFMAAYYFMSSEGLYDGVSFLFIEDLSKPDAILKIGGFTLNILPIVMTAFNFFSSIIYTKGFGGWDKLQPFLLALIFLVLLYNSPSGLALYWTCNNLYSLLKNVFLKLLKKPARDISVIISVVGVAGFIYALITDVYHSLYSERFYNYLYFSMVTQIPVLIYVSEKYILNPRNVYTKRDFLKKYTYDNNRIAPITFLLFGVFFLGVVIPGSVIKSSIPDFVDNQNPLNPIRYIIFSFSVFMGFSVWIFLFYSMLKQEGKNIIIFIMTILSLWSMVDFMFFGKGLGILSNTLFFKEELKFDLYYINIKNNLINLAVVLGIALLIYIIRKKNKIIVTLSLTIAMVSLVIGISDFITINKKYDSYIKEGNLENVKTISKEDIEPVFELSKTGKNVIVLMIDREISSYLPYIFAEKPEIKKQFEGFTYYPNTLSHGRHTKNGAPALFGGYEYTPKEMDKRKDEKLVDKNNEALKVLPVLFSENGFKTTVCDLPYTNYNSVFEEDFFDDYPDIKAKRLEGVYEYDGEGINRGFSDKTDNMRKRAFIFYSFFKSTPVMLQNYIYDEGSYLNPYEKVNTVLEEFINSYAVLKNLDSLTGITDKKINTFFEMDNNTAHSIMQLELPDYIPKEYLENTSLESGVRSAPGKPDLILDYLYTYHVNMAAIMKVGEWLDYLRENDVFDNTRIIVAADHGADLNQFKSMIYDETLDIMDVNPLLMVKDFNSKDYKVSDEFMTNADVPTIATKGIIDNPINPFTKKKITNDAKNGKQLVFLDEDFTPHYDDYIDDIYNKSLYSVENNIFDLDNWEKIN